MVEPIRFAGIGIAATTLLISAVNDIAILAIAWITSRNHSYVGASLPALFSVIFGAATYCDRSRFSRMIYLASTGAGLFLIAQNMLNQSHQAFISEQVAIATMLLMVMQTHFGLQPYAPLSCDDDRPIQLSAHFTP